MSSSLTKNMPAPSSSNPNMNGVAAPRHSSSREFLSPKEHCMNHHHYPHLESTRSPRKCPKDQSPAHHRRTKRSNDEASSPIRRKRTSSSGVRPQPGKDSPPRRSRGQSEVGHSSREEFLFWKPDEPKKSASNRGVKSSPPSKIPVPNKASSRGVRPSRPKMGVPVMTSTPRLFIGKKEEGILPPKQVINDEEPIYCEIGDSGESKQQQKKSRSESTTDKCAMHNFSSSLNRGELESKRHRQSLADFSLKMNSRVPLSASPLLSHRQMPSGPEPRLLGRRAATQFDFFGQGCQQQTNSSSSSSHHHHHHHPTHSQFHSQAPSATTVLSEYRHELPPKSVYNHMSGIPYSQPPQRKFIPGLSGVNGYCSDNDFSSLANESIASSSLPGQTLRGSDLSEININPGSTLKKGLLWQQRDKLFSRWKERFFILTKDYLQCFRRGSSRISEMGAFIFRIKLIEVEEVELIDKRGYLTISLSMGKEGKVLLRKPDGIRDWFNVLKECVSTCKERRGMMKSSKEFWSKKQFTDSSSMEQYVLARQRIGRQYSGSYYTDSSSSQACPFDALPSHLRMKIKGSLSPLSSQAMNASTNNLKHYGYIDVPRSSAVVYAGGNSEGDDKAQLQSLCNDLYLKGNVRDYPSEYSHDSGVDSMNTNSSGSVMSGSITSPMMNRPSKFAFKGTEEDSLSQMQGKHLKSNSERDRKISLV